MKPKNKNIEASVESKNSVLGTFTGKCCDSNVFNNNDMHLSREVFEKLMASDEYKRAMANHHYCGFLGHPSDSDCQDYEHACIVMKDMRILDNGEIEGDFDLIDTPVGRTVKAFTDAGVKFGISIRGLGEVGADGEVDPDEFIFRGFDLVTFPAYDDCIPEFKAIAASTDAKKKAKYKKICAAVDANLKSINSCEALTVLQEQFQDGCDEFNKIQDRIDELNCDDDKVDAELAAQVAQQKLDAMTELYLDAAASVRQLESELAESQICNQDLVIECKSLKHKQTRLDRIVANQIKDANDSAADMEAAYRESDRRLKKVKASLSATRTQLAEVTEELKSTKASYDRQVLANTRLKERITSLNQKRKDDHEAIKASEDLNLKYQHKIESHSEAMSEKDSKIGELEAKLDETVIKANDSKAREASLEQENKELQSRIEAAEDMIASYQQAYANIYANALGVYLKGLPITASTSVEELTDMIKAGTSTANIAPRPDYSVQNEEIDEEEYIEGDDDLIDGNYSAGMVTL